MPKHKYTVRKDGRLVTKTTINGQCKYIYGATDEEIDQKIYELRYNMERGYEETDILFADWAIKWFTSNKLGKVTYKSEETYKNALNNHILPYFKDFKLKDVKEIDIQNFFSDKINFSKSLNHKLVITLKQIFKSAAKNNLIKSNPALEIKETGVETKEKNALTNEQINILLQAVRGTRAETFVNIALYCGLRRGEVLALTWEDVDLTNNTIRVKSSASFQKNKTKEKSTKTVSGNRIVPMPQKLSTHIKNIPHTGKYVVTSASGKLMTHSSFVKMWNIVINALQKPTDKILTAKEKNKNMQFYITPHILRHTYCTLLHYAGVPLKEAQYLMGHSNIAITAKIYTHLDGERVADSAQTKLDNLFSNI